MAGIGFKIGKLFNDIEVTNKIKGSMYAIAISSGPWLATVLVIFSIIFLSKYLFISIDISSFSLIVSHIFCLSLIIFGLIEFVVTRYVADLLYSEDNSKITSSFVVAIFLGLFLVNFLGIPLYYIIGYNVSLWILILFSSSIITIWIAMTFLGAANSYQKTFWAYVIGSIIAMLLSLLLTRFYGLNGTLFGLMIGHLLIAIFLTIQIFNEFDISFQNWKAVFLYYKKYPFLYLAGFLYYSGIWVDKIIYWTTPSLNKTDYSAAMFIAYLTIIPAIAFFFVKAETNFFSFYKKYFTVIDLRLSRGDIIKAKKNLLSVTYRDFFILVKTQVYSVLFFVSCIAIFKKIFTNTMILIMFYGLVAASFNFFFLILNVILLYYEGHKEVFVNYFVFFVSNAIFSYFFINFLDKKYLGLGYTLSTIITFIITLFFLYTRNKNLMFYTFMSQPVISQKDLLQDDFS